MPDHDSPAVLVDRIIAGAHIPSRARRDDLRRELLTHFEDAGASPAGLCDALRRFGPEAAITESLRDVYRWDYLALYLAKIAASMIASIAAALAIEALVNLRVELRAEVWRLAPGFSRAAGVSVAVVLALVTAWETAKQPFSGSRAAAAIGAYTAVCLLVQLLFAFAIGAFVTATMLVVLGYGCSKLAPGPRRLLFLFGAFAGALYVDHRLLSVAFGPARALVASAVLVAIWSSTSVILTRADHAFGHFFDPADGRAD